MDKIEKILKSIHPVDDKLLSRAQEMLDNLTKPLGSLGRLEEIAKKLVAITGRDKPCLKDKVVFTLAADHGVADEGVSAYPKEVTAQMVYNFLRGGAAINVLARHALARVVVVDMGVASDINAEGVVVNQKIAYGTKNIAKGPAMTREEAVRAIEAGIDIFENEYEKGIDITCTGEMGIANTTASSAMACALMRNSPAIMTGKGTGIDANTLSYKEEVIRKALDANNPDPEDSIDVIAKVGGFEIAGLVGVILASAAKRVPVVMDGFISSVAALAAYKMDPRLKDYMIASHCSAEKGHKAVLDFIGLNPILDLNLRLGEGTGAALALCIIDASAKILSEMATFDSAKVSKKK